MQRYGQLKSAFLACALVLALSACSSTQSLDELHAVEPTGDAYHKALAADYREYADEKVARYDWVGSTYFADKGLLAAYGHDIAPEKPGEWQLPPAAVPELEAARAKLVEAIASNSSTQPEMTASAVVAYDRWLDYVHSARSPQTIAAQRATFVAIMTKLTEAHTAAPNVVTPTTTTPAQSRSTVIYFPFDSDHFGDSAQGALAELVRYVKGAGSATININGHTDRAGTEDYNMDLSERRARYTLKTLKEEGIATSRMHYFAFGESDPAVPTADGVREPKNRRVEIVVE